MHAPRRPFIAATLLVLGLLSSISLTNASAKAGKAHGRAMASGLRNAVPHPAAKHPTRRINLWSLVTRPFAGPARAIGTYTAGCLSGGQPLPLTGPGFQVMHPSRHRYYGHPNLVRFVEELGRRTQMAGIGPLLIGDMSQPRGGPTLTGHASHQIGLDVDIWLSQPAAARRRALTPQERETLAPASVVAPNGRSVNRNWTRHTGEIIKLSADSPLVERIFVNPAIKQELCREYPGASWLNKVRPWWLHEDHEHVRLYGPVANPLFHAQARVPSGTGCDAATFTHWFALEGAVRAEQARHPQPKPVTHKMPALPAACMIVLRH